MNNSNISEIYFETYGCTANQNSSEIMKGLVKQAGMNITNKEQFADIIIINSCIVKESTQEKIRRRFTDLLKQGKKVILSGCMPRLNKERLKKKKNLYLLDTTQIKNLINLIKDILENNYNPEKYLQFRNEVKTSLPKIPYEKTIGITQISEGCLGKCTYCITKLAKGKLFSYPKNKIIKSVKKDIESRCKEIWITSQDNASYGKDRGKNSLPELLNEILKLKGRFFVRVGMMNPNNVLKILPELIEIYKHPKMFKFLHIPIQAGSNRTLKKMNRFYKINNVLKIVKKFREQIPDITISTDIIVGYPTETKEDFEETLNVIKEIKPDILNRSNFTARPFTKAAKLKKINPREMKSRAKKLMKLHLEICKKNQDRFKDYKTRVLVDKKGFKNTWLARDKNYRLFAIHSDKNLLGKFLNVKIIKTSPHYLIAKPIKKE